MDVARNSPSRMVVVTGGQRLLFMYQCWVIVFLVRLIGFCSDFGSGPFFFGVDKIRN